MNKKIKSEHSGAKNGGGHWGTRDEAKKLSKKVRRASAKEMIQEESDDLDNKKGSEIKPKTLGASSLQP
jgi:hypothetical protein